MLIRPDNLIYPIAILSYLYVRYGMSIFLPRISIAQKAYMFSFIILFLYSLSEVSLYYARYSKSLLGSYNLLGLGNIVPNLSGNISLILHFNSLFILAVCISLPSLFKNKNGKIMGVLMLWLFMSFIPFLLHLGLFKIRYNLQFSIPLILLSSIGLHGVFDFFKTSFSRKIPIIIFVLMVTGNFVFITKYQIPLNAKNLYDKVAERIICVYDDIIKSSKDDFLLVTLSSYEYCLIKVHDFEQPSVTASYFLHQARNGNESFFSKIKNKKVIFLGSKKVASMRKDHIMNWNAVYQNIKEYESKQIYEDSSVDVFALIRRVVQK